MCARSGRMALSKLAPALAEWSSAHLYSLCLLAYYRLAHAFLESPAAHLPDIFLEVSPEMLSIAERLLTNQSITEETSSSNADDY